MTTPQTTAVVVADAAATTTPEPAIKPSAGPANLSSLRGSLFKNIGGAAVGSFDESKKMCIGLFSNGIFERRSGDIGAFVHRHSDLKVPYLNELPECTPSFAWNLPKPGVGILYSIRDFFFDIMKKMNDAEVMIQLYWDKQEERYFIYVPEQKVMKATINFKHSQELQADPSRYLWVLDIHSHNTMGAFFSSTDSADETSTRVFGVMGTIAKGASEEWADSIRFSTKFRAGVNGKFIELNMDHVFDMEDTTPMPIPQEDYAKVTPGSFGYAAPYVVGGGYAGGNHKPVYAGGYAKSLEEESYDAWDYQGGYGGGSRRKGRVSHTYERTAIDTSDANDIKKAFFELYTNKEIREVCMGIYNFEVRMDSKTLNSTYVQSVTDSYNKMLLGLMRGVEEFTDQDMSDVIIASCAEHFGEEVMRKSVDRFREFKESEVVS